jgi:hypothetical protein
LTERSPAYVRGVKEEARAAGKAKMVGNDAETGALQ